MRRDIVKRIGKKSLPVTGEILLTIADYFDDMCMAQHHPGLVRAMGARQARAYLAEYRREKAYAFTRLKRRSWITERKDGNSIVYRLTQEGRIGALQAVITQRHSPLVGGVKLVVIFDVPEVAKNARTLFRSSLKKMGFKKMQLSCWYTDADVGKPLKLYFKLLRIQKWARIFLSKEL